MNKQANVALQKAEAEIEKLKKVAPEVDRVLRNINVLIFELATAAGLEIVNEKNEKGGPVVRFRRILPKGLAWVRKIGLFR